MEKHIGMNYQSNNNDQAFEYWLENNVYGEIKTYTEYLKYKQIYQNQKKRQKENELQDEN